MSSSTTVPTYFVQVCIYEQSDQSSDPTITLMNGSIPRTAHYKNLDEATKEQDKMINVGSDDYVQGNYLVRMNQKQLDTINNWLTMEREVYKDDLKNGIGHSEQDMKLLRTIIEELTDVLEPLNDSYSDGRINDWMK